MKIYTLTQRSTLLLMLFVVFVACKEDKETQDEESTEEVAENTEETPKYTGDLPLDRLNLPDGFRIDVYAENIEGARSMAMGADGTLFVGTRNEGNVYALKDTDGDYRADEIYTIASDLEQPNGVAFKDGDLYVAAVSRMFKYSGIESRLDNPQEPELIYDDYPTEFHHGWKYIAFGPDDKLYVPVGAPCNICDSATVDKRYASITRMDPDGSNREIVAHGVRNTVGFTWHPDTDELWFTDNGRDMMGDDVPPGELNKLTEVGQHFGYPFCHGGTVKDPEFGDQYPCSDFVPPVQPLGAHVAALGIKFGKGPMFPDSYTGQAFLAEHGSWNRSSKVGYRVTLVKLENGEAVSYEPFIDGWLDEESQEAFGRPVDLLFLEDGSLLISDDEGDAIYRVTYNG
ncbi:sorbosone dehydrogenase family protein [Muricauda sp. 334s03]|uniref:Sorbosone dehydrogenase family protein n=1 Tax=Flagellimonas yonaguniensis TaxID=3031325 RepID=A0ABT5Y457_9FLAO|nr:sorbosone dehydrogenase family protein [[Muricauda] yonaguniensis]MDF0718226.1 sorbosone dehydrogenase family protein [[Muricauda] yonaguniensis]